MGFETSNRFGAVIDWRATVYYFLAPVQKPLTFPARQISPLIVSLREMNFNEIYTSLDCWPIDLLMFAQSILSFVFIFLPGLALRNRFRL